jgi:hypothetical protein
MCQCKPDPESRVRFASLRGPQDPRAKFINPVEMFKTSGKESEGRSLQSTVSAYVMLKGGAALANSFCANC